MIVVSLIVGIRNIIILHIKNARIVLIIVNIVVMEKHVKNVKEDIIKVFKLR